MCLTETVSIELNLEAICGAGDFDFPTLGADISKHNAAPSLRPDALPAPQV